MHDLIDDFLESYGKPVVSMALAAFVVYGVLAGHSKSRGWKVMLIGASVAFAYMQRKELAEFVMKIGLSTVDYAFMFHEFCLSSQKEEESLLGDSREQQFIERYATRLFCEHVSELTYHDQNLVFDMLKKQLKYNPNLNIVDFEKRILKMNLKSEKELESEKRARKEAEDEDMK